MAAKHVKLTPKQENFCLVYLETGNATEAYRRSYNVSRMKPESINRSAKKMVDNGKIAARLDELRAPVREAAQLTLESHLADLQIIRDAALAAGQFGPATTAETNRGRAAGLYVERHEHSGGVVVESKITFHSANARSHD